MDGQDLAVRFLPRVILWMFQIWSLGFCHVSFCGRFRFGHQISTTCGAMGGPRSNRQISATCHTIDGPRIGHQSLATRYAMDGLDLVVVFPPCAVPWMV